MEKNFVINNKLGDKMKKQQFLNTYINNITMEEAISSIEKSINKNEKIYISTINTDVIMQIEKDEYLKKAIDNADLALIDGKPLIWISKLKKKPIVEKISGTDLVPKLCELSSQKKYSIFLLGGKEGVAEKAKEKLNNKYPGINIIGTYAPPLGFEKDKNKLKELNNKINECKPDILIVCFGCPKQEKWIYDNINDYEAKVSVCAGGTIDFLAENVKRAPKWMSNCGLEWFYRFLQEPKRLFKRYFIEDIKIIKLIKKYK